MAHQVFSLLQIQLIDTDARPAIIEADMNVDVCKCAIGQDHTTTNVLMRDVFANWKDVQGGK